MRTYLHIYTQTDNISEKIHKRQEIVFASREKLGRKRTEVREKHPFFFLTVYLFVFYPICKHSSSQKQDILQSQKM